MKKMCLLLLSFSILLFGCSKESTTSEMDKEEATTSINKEFVDIDSLMKLENNITIPEGIVIADTSEYSVIDIGDYENYLNDFYFPSKYLISSTNDDTYTMNIGTDKDTFVFRTSFKDIKDNNVDYSFYNYNRSDVYTFVNKDDTKFINHCKVSNENGLTNFDAMASYEFDKAIFEYDSFAGEKTSNGTKYDLINVNMTVNDNYMKSVFWFTKDGKLSKIYFVGESDKGIGIIQPIESIQIPVTNIIDVVESDEDTVGEIIMNSIMDFSESVLELEDTESTRDMLLN